MLIILTIKKSSIYTFLHHIAFKRLAFLDHIFALVVCLPETTGGTRLSKQSSSYVFFASALLSAQLLSSTSFLVSLIVCMRQGVCMCECVCVCACVRACVCVCVASELATVTVKLGAMIIPMA
jgi:hypothetical protein